METDILSLLPHRPPMLLIDGIINSDSESAECYKDIVSDMPFIRSGELMEPVLAEMSAQATAIHASLTHGVLMEGYLIEIKKFSIFRKVKVGEKLIIKVNLIRIIPPLGLYETEIKTEQGKAVAQGALKFYQKTDG